MDYTPIKTGTGRSRPERRGHEQNHTPKCCNNRRGEMLLVIY